jgi:hypothetical protein
MTYDLYQSFGNSHDVAQRLGISKSAVNRRLQKYHAQFSKFTPPKLPSKSRDIEQLIKDRIEESRRAKNADDARDLVPIPVHIDGPFGLLVLGDPHVDDSGCDFELLAQHRQIIKDHPFILGASVGDYQNGWIGRLGALYGEQQTTSKEAWKLVDWLVSDIKWLFLIAGNHDCLDMQTEALTKRGWIKYQDIRHDDEVMSIDPKTSLWGWYPIISRICREHTGEFITVNGNPVDMRVTPNHRILHKKRNWKKEFSGMQYCQAESLPSRFSIPTSVTNNLPDFDIDDNWLTITGWLLTDGCIRTKGNSPRISFYQSKECPSLEKALDNLDLTPKISVRNRIITKICGRVLKKPPKPQRTYQLNSEQSRKVLSVIPRKKELPSWAFNLSDRQFEILLDAIVLGDGTWDGVNPENKSCAVVHGERQFLESLQICAIQHGWRAFISVARENDLRLNLCKSLEWQADRLLSVKKETSFGEKVWCLTVPLGNFMVRRNGRAYFTGNCWTGAGDPLEWIAAQQGSLYEPHGIRMELQHPCGAKTRIHARHDFAGTSIYSQLHGPRREAIMGYRDDLIICGHKHTGAAETFVTPDGNVCQIVRVSGYKVADSYAKQLGLKKHSIFPGALCIIDPSAPNTSPNRIFTAPSVEKGVIILDALRADYEKSRGASNVQKHKQKTRSKQQPSRRNSR